MAAPKPVDETISHLADAIQEAARRTGLDMKRKTAVAHAVDIISNWGVL